MIKIRGKVDKSNTYNGSTGNISFFIHRTSSDKTFLSFSTFQQFEEIDKIKWGKEAEGEE